MNGNPFTPAFTPAIIRARELPGGLTPAEKADPYPVFRIDSVDHVVIFPWTVTEEDTRRGWPIDGALLDRISPELTGRQRDLLRHHGAWHINNADFSPAADPSYLYRRWPAMARFSLSDEDGLARQVAELADRLGRKHRWCQEIRDDVTRGLRELGINMPGHQRTIVVHVELDNANDAGSVVNDIADTINSRSGVRLLRDPIDSEASPEAPF